MVFVIGIVVVVVALIVIGVLMSRAKSRTLLAAPAGSVRVEAVKAVHVNTTVAQYAKAGWRVTDQTTAKSVGSQARVTLTFTKG